MITHPALAGRIGVGYLPYGMLSFSLIVCTRGRPLLLERLLQGVALLRYREFELIVVCDPADADTAGCLARLAPDAKTGHCAPANLAMARNIGLSMAAGDIAAFIDDDAVPEPDWLDTLAACHARPGIAAAGGVIRGQNGVDFQSFAVVIDPFGTDHHRRRVPRQLKPGWFHGLTGTNFSVCRKAALAVGGFDENYPYFLEETDFLLRLRQAGGAACLAEDAEVHHGFAASEMRMQSGAPKSLRQIGRSKAYFCHINRRPEISARAIGLALARFTAWKLWLVCPFLLTGRMSLAGAKRLFDELQTGLREGAALAKGGRNLPDFFAAAPLEFQPFGQRSPPRGRLCVLLKTAPANDPQWQMIREQAGADTEVTVIYFGRRIFRRVMFAEGIWQHRLAIGWRLALRSSPAMAGEIRRIVAHRRFDGILAAAGEPALHKAAAASGLQIFSFPVERPAPFSTE